jgi:hypothetical protein
VTTATPGVPELLSGGGFGPEASLPGLLVCTAAGIWALRVAHKRGRMVPAGDAVAADSGDLPLPLAGEGQGEGQ